MTRPVWTGALSVGLITAPVRATGARAADHGVKFTTHDSRDGAPIGTRKVNKDTGEEVPADLIERHAITERGEVTVPAGLLEELADPEGEKVVALEGFVDLGDIDPRAFGKVYDLAPDKTGSKAYALLVAALEQTGRAGIGTWYYRGAARLVAVVADAGRLELCELAWADELRAPPELAPVEVTEPERDAAVALVDALAVDWRHADHRDERHARTVAALEALATGSDPGHLVASLPPARDPSEDIMAQLLASVEATRKERSA
jgi:DNA end-binding protein Ku